VKLSSRVRGVCLLAALLAVWASAYGCTSGTQNCLNPHPLPPSCGAGEPPEPGAAFEGDGGPVEGIPPTSGSSDTGGGPGSGAGAARSADAGTFGGFGGSGGSSSGASSNTTPSADAAAGNVDAESLVLEDASADGGSSADASWDAATDAGVRSGADARDAAGEGEP
jgi:hypothetical protein